MSLRLASPCSRSTAQDRRCGYKDCVVVAVSNTAEFADVELAVEADSAVSAGDAIVKVVRK